jgi:hypothetical protein
MRSRHLVGAAVGVFERRLLAALCLAAACNSASSAPQARDGSEEARDIGGLEVGAVGVALGHCDPDQTNSCPASSTCVQGGPLHFCGVTTKGGVCRVPGRESCGCSVNPNPCTTPGFDCLLPACCDFEGLCVTPAERAAVCAGPDRARFDCLGAGYAGVTGTADGGEADRAAGGTSGGGGAPGGGGASGSGGASGGGGAAGPLAFLPDELVYSVALSVTTAGVTRAMMLRNGTGDAVTISALRVEGADAASFVLEGAPSPPIVLPAAGNLPLTVRFLPAAAATVTTVYAARLSAANAAASIGAQAGLFGLAMNAANSEPSLDQVVRALGYAIDVGGTTTTLGTGAARIGDEIAAPRFVKAHAGVVSVQPVARYSPFETAPYGIYTGAIPDVTRTPLGAMSKGAADNVANRTLSPPLDAGAMTTFDPGAAAFGLYAESASNTASLGTDGRLYQEDALNADQGGVLPVHRLRVYPLKGRAGQALADAFFVACEEASNSDYQDYVFVVSNVAAAPN